MEDETIEQNLDLSNTQLVLFFPSNNSSQIVEIKDTHQCLKLHVPISNGSIQDIELLFTNEAFVSLQFAHKSQKVHIETLLHENVDLFNWFPSISDDNEPIEWDLIDKDLSEQHRKYIKQLDIYKTYDNQHPFIRRLVIEILHDYVKNCFSKKDKEKTEELFIKAIENNDFFTWFIKAYTQANSFYRILNRHLAKYILDYFDSHSYSSTKNYRLINCLGHIVTLLIYHPSIDKYKYQGITYRGLVMSENNLRRYQLGYHVVNRAFVSTSKSQRIAEIFCRDSPKEKYVEGISVLFIYTIKQTRTALDIENLSTINSEEEVLILPFSLFKITHRSEGDLVKIELEECENVKEEEREINRLEIEQQSLLTDNQSTKRTRIRSTHFYRIIAISSICICILIVLAILIINLLPKPITPPPPSSTTTTFSIENNTVSLQNNSTISTIERIDIKTTETPTKLHIHRPNLQPNTRWRSNALTVAQNIDLNPFSFELEDDRTMVIADLLRHCILEWKPGDSTGQIIAGGNGAGRRDDQLDSPTDLYIHKRIGKVIICDQRNQRIVQWPRHDGIRGETILSGIHCFSITMDSDEFIYISDTNNHEVRRWKIGDQNSKLIAGGNGKGYRLNQLNTPHYIFVDNQRSVYVSDYLNNRVVKWMEGDREGRIVAGGQLSNPEGLYVDSWGTVYVSDFGRNQIIRWTNGSTSEDIIAGSQRNGDQSHELDGPEDLAFDLDGNLYIADYYNHRIQMFSIEGNL